MRLPRDATLIVVDAQSAIEEAHVAGGEPAIAALLAVWRQEALPIVHARNAAESGAAFAPREEETVLVKRTPSAFAGAPLEATLDALGATTLVICGRAVENSLMATARDAAGLGYRTFLVADADRASDSDAEVALVDCAEALAAGRLARWRERAKRIASDQG